MIQKSMSFKRSKHLTLKNYIIWHNKEAKRIRAQLPVKTAIAFPKLLYIHIAINLSAAKPGKRLEHRLWLMELVSPLPCQQQQHKHGTNLHQLLSVIFSTTSMIQQRNEKKMKSNLQPCYKHSLREVRALFICFTAIFMQAG